MHSELPSELRDAPRYRIGGDDPQFIRGALMRPGAEYDSNGWPPEGARGWLEPVNEPARRILDYVRGRVDPWRPDTLTRAYGEPYLARGGFAPDRKTFGEIPESAREPGMPTWRATREIKVSPDPMRRAFPRRAIEPGEVLTICDWPSKFAEHGLEPANDAARAIAEYEARAGEHPFKPVSPWCEFRRGLFLPALPQASWHGRAFNGVAVGGGASRSARKAA